MTTKTPLMLLLLLLMISCKNNSRPPETSDAQQSIIDTTAYLEQGALIAMKTQNVLGTTLQEKIAQGGAENAIAFCNLRALPLTDSLAIAFDARIRRVTNKARNGANRANSEALALMNTYKEQLAEGKDLKGKVHVKEDHIQTYYPILTAPLCMQCHGSPENDIKAATMSSILERYPADRAIGYKPGELRGVWSIQFKRQ